MTSKSLLRFSLPLSVPNCHAIMGLVLYTKYPSPFPLLIWHDVIYECLLWHIAIPIFLYHNSLSLLRFGPTLVRGTQCKQGSSKDDLRPFNWGVCFVGELNNHLVELLLNKLHLCDSMTYLFFITVTILSTFVYIMKIEIKI